MPTGFNLNRRALDRLVEGADGDRMLRAVAEQVRDEARRNAERVSPRRAQAIIADAPSTDSQGAYVDVGYDRTDTGFALWWTEVGTVDQPARPHLRPALRPGLIR